MSAQIEERLCELEIDRMERQPGLETICQLLLALGNPQDRIRTIHVAGTNGKGSVCVKLAAALGQVGLYTSPHISTFYERIRIGLVPIGSQAAQQGLIEVFEAADRHGLSPSYFEVMTALAFWYFAARKLELAVIETGLGGRLDATNVITPICSVITSIGYDHCDRLGYSLEEIAREKAGIIKPSVPVVAGPTTLGLGIEATHRVVGRFVDYREENRAIAKATLELLGLNYDSMGLEQEMPYRFEIVKRPMPLILDVAHNRPGIERLLEAVRVHYPRQPITVVVGCSINRDPMELFASLQEVDRVHIVQTDHPRVLPVAELLPLAASLSLGTCGPLSTVLQELTANPPAGVIVVCGSHFIMEGI